MQRVVEIQKMDLSSEFEVSLRPKEFSEFVGQEQIKSNLAVFIEAAKMRGETLDHALFYGPPGLGKTTLSHIIASQMQKKYQNHRRADDRKKRRLGGDFDEFGGGRCAFH